MSATSSTTAATGMICLEHLLEILQQQAQAFSDPRNEQRIQTQSPATLEVMDDTGQHHVLQRVWVTDISRIGVGMILEQPVQGGSLLILNLSALAEENCRLPIQVFYCRQLMSRTYRVGATFRPRAA